MSEYTTVLQEGELQEGAMQAVKVDGTSVLLSRSEEDEVCAIANTCTHAGGPLNEGERDGDVVTCPWHGSKFDLCSGEVVGGPADESEQRFEARTEEGQIEVRPV